MTEAYRKRTEVLEESYSGIKQVFLAPETSNSDRLRILKRFVSHMKVVSDLNTRSQKAIHYSLDYVFEGSLDGEMTPLLDFERKYHSISDFFEAKELARYSREAILITLLHDSGEAGLIPMDMAALGAGIVSDVMRSESTDRMGYSKKGGPAVDSLRDIFPGLNWYLGR